MAKGAKAREDFHPGPIDGVDLSELPPLPDDLPPLPDAGAAAPVGTDQAAKPEPKPDQAEPLPPLPERSLGLDLYHEAAGTAPGASGRNQNGGMGIRAGRPVRTREGGCR